MSADSSNNIIPDCDKAKAAAHTGGPWKILGEDNICLPVDDGRCLRIAYIDAGYWFIPEGVFHQIGADAYQALADQIRAANARLIAAAPDLLEALRPFAQLPLPSEMHAADDWHSTMDRHLHVILTDAIRAARSAIQRAEGGQ